MLGNFDLLYLIFLGICGLTYFILWWRNRQAAVRESQRTAFWLPEEMSKAAEKRDLGEVQVVLRIYNRGILANKAEPERPLAAFERGLVNAQGRARKKSPKAYLWNEVVGVFYDEIRSYYLEKEIQSVVSQNGYVMNLVFQDGERANFTMFDSFTTRTLASDFFKYGVRKDGQQSIIYPSFLKICNRIADAKVAFVEKELESGAVVEFGVIKVDRDQISDGKTSIMWEDLFEIAMGFMPILSKKQRQKKRRTVEIYGKKSESGRRAKIEVPAIEVCNYDTLFLMYHRKEKSNNQLTTADLYSQ